MAEELSDADILRMLRADIQKYGSQAEWSRQNGISRPHLNRVLNRERDFGPRILKALKLKKVFVRT
jgi:hypothetical protein